MFPSSQFLIISKQQFSERGIATTAMLQIDQMKQESATSTILKAKQEKNNVGQI